MNINELYLKTIFCCMACDGEIDQEELTLVSEITAEQKDFHGLDIEQVMNKYVTEINANGALFINNFIKELGTMPLSEEQQLRLIDYAVRTINANESVEYSEVKFFKKIRNQLSLSDEQILEHQQYDIEDWLLPDIKVAEAEEWENVTFETIKLTLDEQK